MVDDKKQGGSATLPASAEESPSIGADGSPQGPVFTELLAYVKQCFADAEQARQSSGVEAKLISSKLRRAGKYSAAQKALISQQGQQEVFIRHTSTKCMQAEAVFEEIETTVSARSWSIDPSPIPDVPDSLRDRVLQSVMDDFASIVEEGQIVGIAEIEAKVEEKKAKMESEVLRESKKRCGRAEKKIRDHLVNFDWDKVYEEVRSQGITCGTGILKGPVVRNVKMIEWQGDVPVAVKKPMAIAESVDPLMFYPEAGISEVNQGYVVEKGRIGRSDLYDLIGLPGYEDAAIRNILKSKTESIVDSQADQSRYDAEKKDSVSAVKNQFDTFEFWGTVSGGKLKAAGKQVEDEAGEYPYQVIWCNDQIIKVMFNPDPLGENPYQVWRYKNVPGSFWGDGPPELMSDKQDFINAGGRSLAINCGLVAGPQTEVDKTRWVDGQNFNTVFPLKVWVTKNPMGLTVPGVRFNKIDSAITELMAVIDRFMRDSDDATGLQPFTYGSDRVAGAGRTYSGMAQLTQLSMRGIKQSVRSLDRMKASFFKRLYTWFVMHTTDEDFRGDAQVVARGTLGLMLSDLRMQRLKEAIESCRADPNVMAIIGPQGLTKLLREYMELLLPSGSEVVPSDTDVMAEIDKHSRQMEMISKVSEQAGGKTPSQTPPAPSARPTEPETSPEPPPETVV